MQAESSGETSPCCTQIHKCLNWGAGLLRLKLWLFPPEPRRQVAVHGLRRDLNETRLLNKMKQHSFVQLKRKLTWERLRLRTNYVTGPSQCEHLERQVNSAPNSNAHPLLYWRVTSQFASTFECSAPLRRFWESLIGLRLWGSAPDHEFISWSPRWLHLVRNVVSSLYDTRFGVDCDSIIKEGLLHLSTRPVRQFIKEAESVALLHNTLPQAVKSDRALLNNNETTKTHCTMSPSKNRGNNGMHLKGGKSNKNSLSSVKI